MGDWLGDVPRDLVENFLLILVAGDGCRESAARRSKKVSLGKALVGVWHSRGNCRPGPGPQSCGHSRPGWRQHCEMGMEWRKRRGSGIARNNLRHLELPESVLCSPAPPPSTQPIGDRQLSSQPCITSICTTPNIKYQVYPFMQLGVLTEPANS